MAQEMAQKSQLKISRVDDNEVTTEATANANAVEFDEKTLAEASIAGNTNAFEELYEHYFPKVRNFCMRKTSNAALAEDIAQEAFARAYERIEDFGGPTHFGGWVGTIAANLITDHYRRKRNNDVSLEARYEGTDNGPSYEVDPIRSIQRDDTTRLVRLAMDKLEPRQREALMLHEIKGMTCAAVGEQFGISEVAAESLLARARRRLRKEITAKATPADLFGVGGIAVLPALARAWRRMREATGRKLAGLQNSASRALDTVGGSALPAAEGARALAVVVGAAIVVELASAAAPQVIDTKPVETPIAVTPAAERAPLPADGDTGSARLISADLGDIASVQADIDPDTGGATVDAEGQIEAPPAADSQPLVNWDASVEGDGLDNTVTVQVYVQDKSRQRTLFDTGEIQQSVDLP